MQKTRLGRTDMEISRLCLGTMTFGVQTDEDDAFAQMDMAVEAGINCFDTAELYPVLPISKRTQGESERIIGRWLKSREQQGKVLVFSKVAGIGSTSTREGEPIDALVIERAIERSLKNLQLDCIDLYQLHWPNRGHYHFRRIWDYHVESGTTAEIVDNLCEIIEALDKLEKQGKIRAYGVSNDTAWGLMKMLEIGEREGWLRCASAQQEYSLLNRIYEPDLQEIGMREDVSLLTYSSLAGGILTGKYGLDGKTIPENSRRSIEPEIGGRIRDGIWTIVEDYLTIARQNGIDPVHFAYRYALSRAFVGAVIIGATDQAQLHHILSDDYAPLPEHVQAEIETLRRKYPMPL